MNLKEIVENYATKENEIVNVDLKSLSTDNNFRSLVISAIVQELKQKPQACVLIPAYRHNSHLGALINELALTSLTRTLVAGGVQNLRRIRSPFAKDVILIKQSFRNGKELAKHIAEIKKMGSRVTVVCLIAHSRAKFESFAKENKVDMKALVYTDEI